MSIKGDEDMEIACLEWHETIYSGGMGGRDFLGGTYFLDKYYLRLSNADRDADRQQTRPVTRLFRRTMKRAFNAL